MIVSVEGVTVDGRELGSGWSEREGEGDMHSSVGCRSVPVEGSPMVLVTTDDSPGFVEISTRPPCSMTLCNAAREGGEILDGGGAKSVTTTDFPDLAEGSLTANFSFSCTSGGSRGDEWLFTIVVTAF